MAEGQGPTGQLGSLDERKPLHQLWSDCQGVFPVEVKESDAKTIHSDACQETW